jgi:PilZ domain-containing protein
MPRIRLPDRGNRAMSGDTHKNKRREERVATMLPVDVENAAGIVRDVSASGIFFEIDAKYTVGSSISFAVKLDTPSGDMNLKCRGRIVRIEPRDSRVGVAVEITESMMEAAT